MGAYAHLEPLSETNDLNSEIKIGASSECQIFTFEEFPWKKWKASEYGTPGSVEFRICFFNDKDCEVSPWHNIPLYSENGLIHYMCTTPKSSDIEYQIDQNLPIPQLQLAQRNGNISQFRIPPPWNIGILPQTISDSKIKSSGEFSGFKQDEFPLKVIEIGSRISFTGEICTLRPLYVVTINEGTVLSRVIVAIDNNHCLASSIKTHKDVESFLPGTVDEIMSWLENCYGLNEDGTKIRSIMYLSHDKFTQTAMEVIAESHAGWQLFADSQPDWLIGNTDYGRSIWRNYKIHVGKSNLSISDFPARELKYDRAWFDSLDFDDCERVGNARESKDSKSKRKKRESRVADDSRVNESRFSEDKPSETVKGRESMRRFSKRNFFLQCFCINPAI